MSEAVKSSTAPVDAKNGEAPRRKFGSANNFSSDSVSRGNRRGMRNRNNRREHVQEEKPFDEQTLMISRVSRTVKGGRRLRFKALVVVGDRKNHVGVGVAKGRDVQQAIEKATNVAKKSMIVVAVENETIPHEVELKYGASRILLKPAAPGTGIIAGGTIQAIIATTQIHNLVSKSIGSTNKVNVAYATIKALAKIKPRSEWVSNQSKKESK